MDGTLKIRDILGRVTTSDLWIELARRLGVKFGKIQMAIHDGRPSKYANVDLRISMGEETCESDLALPNGGSR